MGRWAQQKRAGGGPQTLGYMHLIERGGTDILEVTFSQVVNSANLTPADFVTLEGGTPASTAINLTPTKVQFNFPIDVDVDEFLVYEGTTPGLITPQTKPID